MHRHLLQACGLALFILVLSPRGWAAKKPAERIEFNRDIRPILSDKCFKCHGPDSSHRKAGLRFDTEKDARIDLGGYHAIVPGKPDESELMARLTSPNRVRKMPPVKSGKKMSAEEIALFRRWIEQGAEFQPHWSYAPQRRPAVPDIKQKDWPINDVDCFVLAKLESVGLKPSPQADKITLIRRLYFDLLGLPPPLKEVEAFLTDRRPDAYERLVDRLLASPHYGERMAMYWLDLVRYADTVGYHGDQEHHISPYRDYVIKAFKDNMPFDQFTIEQLAGDLLPNPTVDQKIATGYNRVLQTTHEGGAQDKEYRAIYAADRVRNISGVWMGSTMGCAQCHDHKYDPYTQKDFYSLVAFFADIQERGANGGPDATPTKRPPEIRVLSPLDRDQLEQLQARIDILDKQLKNQADKATILKKEIAGLQPQAAAIRKRKRLTMVTASIKPRTIRILKRGDWMDDSGEIVQPAVPHFLKPVKAKGRATRLDLARWLTSPDNPQTARVFVNRLWYLFFGAGLCRTLDDTGSQGEWPTHPQLLDWLATEFIESGWNVKHMVKQIVMSQAYRQSSLVSKQLKERDPENRLLARQGRFRLPAEMIRDNALAVSGLLVDRIGGAPARPYQPAGYYAHLNFPRRTYRSDKDANQYRRGVYTHWQRQFLHPMLRAFDAPSREECTARRPVSNTPLAALTLLNDPTFVEAARVFAASIVSRKGSTSEKIGWAWRNVLSRKPIEREVAALARLYQASREQYQADNAAARKILGIGLAKPPVDINVAELAAWTAVARVLLNLNETITRN